MYIHLDCSLQKSRLLLHPYVLQVSNRSGLPIALLQTPTQTYPCFPLQNIYKRKGNLSQLAGLQDQSVGGENSAWQDNSLHLNSNFRQEGCKLQLVTLAKVYEIKYIQSSTVFILARCISFMDNQAFSSKNDLLFPNACLFHTFQSAQLQYLQHIYYAIYVYNVQLKYKYNFKASKYFRANKVDCYMHTMLTTEAGEQCFSLTTHLESSVQSIQVVSSYGP